MLHSAFLVLMSSEWGKTKVIRWLLVWVMVSLMSIGAASAETQVTARITTIQSYRDHTGILIALDTPYRSDEGCGGQVWYIFPDNSPRAAFVQSLLLASHHGRQAIAVTVSGCHENYPRIIHVTSGF